MTQIGILGASSQVGSSVAFFLKKFPGVQVTCFIRSSYSRVFFEMLGLTYQYVDLNNSKELEEKIGQLDVILDFGYPAGQLHEILARSKESIAQVFKAMKKGSSYFYMSSIMAYGMPGDEKWIKNYSLPRTSYAYIKRSIEKFTLLQGKAAGIKVYNFRLGQVHGFLQSVNSSFRKKLSDTNIALIDGKEDNPVNTIFIYTLCEGIIQCTKGVCPPGLYTLVSYPQWTLKELYQYYQDYYGLRVTPAFVPDETPVKGKGLLQRGLELARPYRPLLETYVLMRFPSLITRIKGRYRQSELLNQRSSALKKIEYIDFNLLGKPSLAMIPGLTTDPARIAAIEKEYEADYNSIISSKRK